MIKYIIIHIYVYIYIGTHIYVIFFKKKKQIAYAIIYYWRKPQGMDKYKRYQTPYTLS